MLVASVNIFLTNISYGWRISYGSNVFLSVMLIVLLFFVSELPHFLVGKGRNEEARKALSCVRCEDWIYREVKQLEMEALQVKVLQMIQQLSSINAYVTHFSILQPTSDVTPLINSFLSLSFCVLSLMAFILISKSRYMC